MSEASQHPLWQAIGGGAGITAISGVLLNSGIVGGISLIIGVPVAFAFLGYALGKGAGKKAMPLVLPHR